MKVSGLHGPGSWAAWILATYSLLCTVYRHPTEDIDSHTDLADALHQLGRPRSPQATSERRLVFRPLYLLPLRYFVGASGTCSQRDITRNSRPQARFTRTEKDAQRTYGGPHYPNHRVSH
jgi:hypothetical protein